MLFVEAHVPPEQRGDGGLGEIVRRRPQSAGGDHGTGAVERFAHDGGDFRRHVADGGATCDLDADGRELARQVRGVRVDREAEQQLVADRDDFDARDRRHYFVGAVAKTPLKLRKYTTSE